jgi:hypothetical protein
MKSRGTRNFDEILLPSPFPSRARLIRGKIREMIALQFIDRKLQRARRCERSRCDERFVTCSLKPGDDTAIE